MENQLVIFSITSGFLILAISITLVEIIRTKRTEKILQNSEKKYKLLFNSSGDSIYIHDDKSRILAANDTASKQLGYTIEELMKMLVSDVDSPNDEAKIPERISKLMKDGYVLFETNHQKKDGSLIPMEVNAQEILWDEKPAIMSTCRDITERKKAEKILQETISLNDTIISSIPGTFYMLDDTGKYVRWNKFQRDEIVAKGEEIKNTNAIDTIYQEDREFIGSKIVNVLQNGFPEVVEGRVLLHGGPEFVWLLMTGNRVMVKDKAFLVGIGIDITERKITEDKLKESTTKLSMLFNSMTEMVALHELVFNENGDAVNYRIIDCNTAYTKITGIKKEDAVGKIATELYKTEKPAYFNEYSTVALTGKAYEFTTYFEPMDKYFLISVASPIKGQFATITTDITNIKKAEEKLKELDKLKDEFLSVTTHELKTPLIPISTQVQMFLNGTYGKLTLEQKNAMEMISRNEKMLDQISSEVLDIAKIKSNKLKLTKEQTDLGKLIYESVEGLVLSAKEKNCKISLLPFLGTIKINIDKFRISQVINNLLNNAIKFTPNGGEITVEILDSKDEIIVKVKVKDNGIGIEEKNIEKLFLPFFQISTDLSRKYRGTGLGLAICKGIIEAHGGKIWAESDGEGKGTLFIFTLPLKE